MADSGSDSVASRLKLRKRKENSMADCCSVEESVYKSRQGSHISLSNFTYPRGYGRYWKQVEKSEGFDIIDFPGVSVFTDYVPSDLADEAVKEKVTDCAIKALKHYNKQFKTKFVFSQLLWATQSSCAVTIRNITFEAVEGGRADDPAAVKKFQAKVSQKVGEKKVKVEFCRLRKEQKVAFKPYVYPITEPIRPSNLKCEDEKKVITNCAIEALKHYNEEFKTHFAFSKLNYANKTSATDGLFLYITFEAKDESRGRKFQAKVFQDALSMKVQVMFCRMRNNEVSFDPPFMYRYFCA